MKSPLALSASAAVLLTLAACTSSMVTTRPVESITPDDARGSMVYALPKTLVSIKVKQSSDPGPADVTLTPKVVADPVQVYVLDYTPNPLSSDNIIIDSRAGITRRSAALMPRLPTRPREYSRRPPTAQVR